jgi:hypothetical protein
MTNTHWYYNQAIVVHLAPFRKAEQYFLSSISFALIHNKFNILFFLIPLLKKATILQK